jgi:hypothetical protein
MRNIFSHSRGRKPSSLGGEVPDASKTSAPWDSTGRLPGFAGPHAPIGSEAGG